MKSGANVEVNKKRIILLFARITSFRVYVFCHNDVLTLIIHALHCYGQWLIVTRYCASINFLYHVVLTRLQTSNYNVANGTWPDALYHIAVHASPDAHCVIAHEKSVKVVCRGHFSRYPSHKTYMSKAYLDAFRHSSRERTFVGSVTVVESSRQLRQLDFTYNSSLAMYWCSIGCWMLPLAWMFRAELYNIVPHEMYLVLPDGFKLLFLNVLHIFI